MQCMLPVVVDVADSLEVLWLTGCAGLVRVVDCNGTVLAQEPHRLQASHVSPQPVCNGKRAHQHGRKGLNTSTTQA